MAMRSIAVPASAQIIEDNSLGPTPSVITPIDAQTDRIDGGAQRGANLFHSFQEFNIEAGRGVYFANPSGIETILTRVTGGNASELMGTLGVLGNADLFFLNPNGIIFGPNAQLDIRGSFLATTADGIQFDTQGLFSASDPQAPPLLTIAPSALFFSGSAAGAIINRSVAPTGTDASGGQALGLRVPNGESLMLAGGEVIMDGGGLNALGGHIDLIGIAGAGQVEIISENMMTATPLSLNIPETIARSDVLLQNGSKLDVTADNRGSITLQGQNIDILGGSRLLAGIAPGLGTSASKSGDIILRASDALTVEGPNNVIYNVLGDGATGNSGSLIVEANNFIAQNSAFIVVATLGEGNAGRVSLQVEDSVELTNSSTIFNSIASPDGGETEGIAILADSLTLLEGAELVSGVRGMGQTGGIRLNISDAIVMDGVGSDGLSSGIFASTRPGTVGFSGDVFVSANSLDITRGARIQTGTRGQGNAGNVTVEVDGRFLLDGADPSGSLTGIFTDLDTDGEGRGGNIQVTAGSLVMNNGAQFTAATFSLGDAGDITVDVRSTASFDGVVDGLTTGSTPDVLVAARSGLFSNVGQDLGNGQTIPAIGNGGKITLNANSISLTNGARFGTTILSDSVGNAAPILVTANEGIIVSGENELVGSSSIATEVQPGARGNASDIEVSAASLRVSQGGLLNASIANDGVAGKIVIDTRVLDIVEGGRVIVATSDSGNAGNIILVGQDSITLAGENSGLFANTTADSTGNSGSISLIPRTASAHPRTVSIRDGAQIAVDSQGTGTGGNILLETDALILNNNALISAETASNQGGDITLLIGDLVLLRNGSNISTNAGTAEADGDGGNIMIDVEDGFIVAVPQEDSNITANAFLGQGGNVIITARGIFGIEFRETETPLSDITASSNFGSAGTVVLNLLNIDPTQGTAELPTDTGTSQISQRCNPGEGASSFVDTGRGGIPLGPGETITSQDLWEDLYLPESQAGNRNITSSSVTSEVTPIVEAQGWVVSPDGQVRLVANAPTGSPSDLWRSHPTCSLSG